jgi:lysophospholipase L1-like esterase
MPLAVVLGLARAVGIHPHRAGQRPYTKEPKYQEALRFDPQFVVIMLGTNDTKPRNYKCIEQFLDDYKRLVESFQSAGAAPKIFACTPVSVY